MLRLISAKKLAGAVDSNFSREKMSILSAVKLCMAYYSHKDIIWVPISLEEMLRASGGAGYSQTDGLLSAKNLGFDNYIWYSPIEAESFEGMPPAYIETAEFDCLHDDGILYTRLLREAGIEVTLNETKGTMHGFDIATKAPTTLAAIQQRIAFMKRMIC